MSELIKNINDLSSDLKELFTPRFIDRRTHSLQASPSKTWVITFLSFFGMKKLIIPTSGIIGGLIGSSWIGPKIQQIVAHNDIELSSSVINVAVGLVIGLFGSAISYSLLENLRTKQVARQKLAQYKIKKTENMMDWLTPRIKEKIERFVETKSLPPQALEYFNEKINKINKSQHPNTSSRERSPKNLNIRWRN